MQLVLDGAIAFLSAVGLMTLLWLLTELLWSRQRREIPLMLVLPAAREAEDLEYRLQLLAEQRSRWNPELPIWLVDCGLSASARERARELCRSLPGVELTEPVELAGKMQEKGNEPWESAAR
ncbi:MAG: hypothetical protein E7457_04915 [Ruminococcaceae bacterium]|nr:hypothetical protein [Oscillospiraceae bacterium]